MDLVTLNQIKTRVAKVDLFAYNYLSFRGMVLWDEHDNQIGSLG